MATYVLQLVLFLSVLQHTFCQPSLSITNLGTFQTTVYEWGVTKSSSVDTLSIQQGTTGSVDYTVTFTQTAGPPIYTVSGQVVVMNPFTVQLQLSEIEVTVQYVSGSTNGPIPATVTCPADQTLNGILLVNTAVPDSAVGQLTCNFTAQLPNSDEGFVTAQAIQVSGAAPLTSAPESFAIDPDDPSVPTLNIGECANVNDTFDPLSYQNLGPPKIMKGSKPPRDGQTPDNICSTTTYTYTMQWSIASQAACGDYMVASTAVVNPIGGTQPVESTTVYVEVNACNSAEVAVTPIAPDQQESDSTTPQLVLSVVSITGGGTGYTWGLSNTVSSAPDVQVARGGTAQVTFTTAFTRAAATQNAPLTITGAITVTNPTGEDMDLTEVEVSYTALDLQQQVDTPAACQGSVGGNVLVPANQYITCMFTVTYTSQQAGSLWASAVTATGLTGQSSQVPVSLDNQGSLGPVGSCAMVGQGFESGQQGLVIPASFVSGSQVPPSNSSPVQLCDSAIYTYTAVFGPLNTCGKTQAVNTASANPVGGQQSTQSEDISATLTVLC